MLSQLLIAMLMAAPVSLQDGAEARQEMPKRVRSILLYGNEQCPKSTDPDEVVVCANAGDSPYRIPKQFRDKPEEGPTGQAWTNRMETVEEVNRAGLPNSCSPVGTGGQTGCTRQWLRQWAQERLDQKAKAARVP
ncbi:hypothetical protein LQ953_07355 [Sphingomonas sp. IC-56]|uniref:hypothetical protein n=1 Tax=Sphingomonas sp. IC-56 TaxID=2898529 RepID=UPI001E5D178F|nr:hypothetical protein [Sphingomonas sp. IC-56]MCD2323831.1 hypothetical protein [Sphingomonas sp. IC-56]